MQDAIIARYVERKMGSAHLYPISSLIDVVSRPLIEWCTRVWPKTYREKVAYGEVISSNIMLANDSNYSSLSGLTD